MTQGLFLGGGGGGICPVRTCLVLLSVNWLLFVMNQFLPFVLNDKIGYIDEYKYT